MIKYPILYEQNEQDFFHLGLGPIKTTTKATVTEERNGSFILDMTVVIDDEVFPLLLENRIIKADAGHLLKEQRFRIKRIVPNAKNKATIYAEHVSYLSAELPIKPDLGVSNGNAQAALNQWKSGLIGENEFTVDSDISTANSAKWRIDKFKNPREILGGVEGSILDKWGGEYRFDNYHISLLKKRGTTAETMLSYGRNITDFEQERNITTTYTSIYPYAIYSDEKQNEHLVTIDGYVVDVETVNNFPNRNVLVVDFSSEFDSKDIPTKQKLETLAKQYIKANNVGIPKVSIKVSFLDLSKTADYQNFAPLEQVNLCDDVFVRYPKQKVSTTAKVVKTVWNVLTETYDEIEIGEKRTSLSGIINQTEKKANEANTQSNQALTSANGKNTNFYGLYGDDGLGEPQANKVGDLWYKPNGEETEMYQWNGTIWEFIMSTAGITSAQEAADEAKKNAEDAKEEAEQATDSANKAVSDATHAVSVADQSKVAADEAKADAATAIENAQSILNDLQNLDTVNLLKNSTWNLGKGDWTGGRTYFEVLDP
ncbi:phage tail spike protein, partial [Enterococcus faecium]|uniref:phage tail spike protein n=1 Tax=Enterococcus faecium TaxID=1352 RepID=UPI0039A5E48E